MPIAAMLDVLLVEDDDDALIVEDLLADSALEVALALHPGRQY